MRNTRLNSTARATIVAALWWLAAGSAVGATHAQCSDCHLHADPESQGKELSIPPADLCLHCHAERVMGGEHPSGIAPGAQGTGGLPLVDGLIDCITCHDPHGSAANLLRLPGDRLCSACHDQ